MLSNFVKARENKDCLMDLVEKMPQPEITTLLLLIKPKMKEILISSHKFCQKFFERLRPEERVCVLKEILPFFVVISLNKWGSISLQALISFITLPEEEDLLLQSVRGNVSKLALNKYSNFVIQKLTQKISGAKLPLIITEVTPNFTQLANSNLGVYYVKSLVQVVNTPELQAYLAKELLTKMNVILMDTKSANLVAFIEEKLDDNSKKQIVSFLFNYFGPGFVGNFSSICLIKCIRVNDYNLIKGFYPSVFFCKKYFLLICSSIQGKAIVSEMFIKLNKPKREELYNILTAYCDESFPKENIQFLERYL